jgi:hypothetical protein
MNENQWTTTSRVYDFLIIISFARRVTKGQLALFSKKTVYSTIAHVDQSEELELGFDICLG